MKALNRPVVLERASAMDAGAYVVDFHLERPNRLGAMHFELLLDPSRNVLSRPDFELEAQIDPDLAAILAEEHDDAKPNEPGN
jgi:hypothetical protein